MSKKKKILIIGGAAAVLILIVVVSISANRKNGAAVQTGKVQRKTLLESKVSASGEIKPKEFVELQAEIDGVITHVAVQEGDRVKKGDLLMQIDPTRSEADFRAQNAAVAQAQADSDNQLIQITVQQINLERDKAGLISSQADLQQRQADLTRMDRTFKRMQQMHEEKLLSDDQYELSRNELAIAKTNVETAKARLRQVENQVKAAELAIDQMKAVHRGSTNRILQARATLSRVQDTLSKATLRSPLTGVITKLNVEVGERAVPGMAFNPQATLMEIADMAIIEAEIKVDETDIVNVKVGQIAKVKVDALIDKTLTGTVTEVGNSALLTSQAGQQQQAKDFKVVIRLDNPPESLRPGLSCTAEITTAIKKGVIAIPIQAIVPREYPIDAKGNLIREEAGKKPAAAKDGKEDDRKKKEFQGIFKIASGKVVFHPIETGIMGDTEIEVTKGLNEGDEIVTGNYKTLRTLKDGSAVKVDNSTVKKETDK